MFEFKSRVPHIQRMYLLSSGHAESPDVLHLSVTGRYHEAPFITDERVFKGPVPHIPKSIFPASEFYERLEFFCFVTNLDVCDKLTSLNMSTEWYPPVATVNSAADYLTTISGAHPNAAPNEDDLWGNGNRIIVGDKLICISEHSVCQSAMQPAIWDLSPYYHRGNTMKLVIPAIFRYLTTLDPWLNQLRELCSVRLVGLGNCPWERRYEIDH